MKKLCGMQDSREKKGTGMRDQDTPPPPSPFQTLYIER